MVIIFIFSCCSLMVIFLFSLFEFSSRMWVVEGDSGVLSVVMVFFGY